MRIGLFVSTAVPGDSTIGDTVAAVARAETDGFASVWASGRFDPLTQIAAAAGSTDRIELGTAVVQTYLPHLSRRVLERRTRAADASACGPVRRWHHPLVLRTDVRS